MKFVSHALSGILSFLLILSPLFADAASRKKTETLDDLSRDAYVWGYPAVFVSQTREAMLSQTKNPKATLNHFMHSTKTPDPFLSTFINVNPENIYSWAWVDLSKEPLVMTHPQITDRFYSVQFIDAYSNVFQTVSNNNFGDRTGTFVLTPPGWKGVLPKDSTQIRASTPEIFILAQTFVHDAKDLVQISKVINHRQLIPLSLWKKDIQVDNFTEPYPEKTMKVNKNLASLGVGFYQDLQQILAKNPPATKAEDRELERFAPIGLQDRSALEQNLAPLENRKALERGLFEGERDIQARLAAGFGPKINGWSYELKVAPFSEDFLLRAAVSQRYLFSVPPEETLQMTLDADSESRQLFSSYKYVLHFEKEDFPASRNMWSLKVHEMKNKNVEELSRPIATLNDRTARLKYNMDGSVDILFQSEKPDTTLRANWVPLSKNANFYLVLTMFNPSNTVLNRKYIAPSLTRLDDSGIPKQKVTRTMMAEVRVSH